MGHWNYTFDPRVNIDAEGLGGTELLEHSNGDWSLEIQSGREFIILGVSLPSRSKLNQLSEKLSTLHITHMANTTDFFDSTFHHIKVKFDSRSSRTLLNSLEEVIPNFSEIYTQIETTLLEDTETLGNDETPAESYSSFSS